MVHKWDISGAICGSYVGYFWNLYGPKYKRFMAFWGGMQYRSKIGNSMWPPNMGPNMGSNAGSKYGAVGVCYF